MSLKGRLDKLERRAGTVPGGRCPACPPIAFLYEDEDGTLRDEAGNVITDEQLRCKTCGGPPPGVFSFIIIASAPPREDGADAGEGATKPRD